MAERVSSEQVAEFVVCGRVRDRQPGKQCQATSAATAPGKKIVQCCRASLSSHNQLSSSTFIQIPSIGRVWAVVTNKSKTARPPATDFSVGKTQFSIMTGEFDGGQDPRPCGREPRGQHIFFLLGKSDGTFAQPMTHATGLAQVSIVIRYSKETTLIGNDLR